VKKRERDENEKNGSRIKSTVIWNNAEWRRLNLRGISIVDFAEVDGIFHIRHDNETVKVLVK
jgi:hypothetical protein